MATGKNHTTASIIAAAALGLAGSPALVAGCLAGIALSPDLDQEGLSEFENRLVRYTLGVGWLWIAAWLPYAWIIPHRHWVSHLPLVGTGIRVGYLAALLLLLHVGLCYGFRVCVTFPLDPQTIALAFAGLAVSDFLHWLMDGCPPLSFAPKLKRTTRSWWRRKLR